MWLPQVGREWIEENLRDNMSALELVLNMLAEATTTEISKTTEPQTFEENRQAARRGGRIAGNTRKEIEADTGTLRLLCFSIYRSIKALSRDRSEKYDQRKGKENF